MSSRHLIGLLVVSSVLCACAPAAPEVVRTAGSPAYAPTEYVAMLDSAPARAYQQIGVIEVAGEPGSFRAQVLAQVTQQAQKMGADAVILQDVSRTAPAATRLNPTTGTYDSTGGQLIPAFKGIAIKYR
jgi:hypothetical protein